ncbi:MAG: A/G-specific adenine glycosylase [Acidimicrobiia bacterium]
MSPESALADDEAASKVLAWAPTNGRDLPWRRTRNPWHVLLSEVMAQQTQVDRVIPKWLGFVDAYGDPAVMAAAPLAEVLVAWSGLGYPRRARDLHRSAQVIVERHGGQVPDSLEALLALPGIGPYTARAVLAFAFERDVAVVDTNVARVMARTNGRTLRAAEVQSIADECLPPGEGWAWNQALLDLGAMVCTARNPGCHRCPVRDRCVWRGEGDDPALGSAGVSGRQARFDGSDRQGRGRLMRVLGTAPVPSHELAIAMGWPADPDRALRVVSRLVDDGLVEWCNGWYRLPAS